MNSLLSLDDGWFVARGPIVQDDLVRRPRAERGSLL